MDTQNTSPRRSSLSTLQPLGTPPSSLTPARYGGPAEIKKPVVVHMTQHLAAMVIREKERHLDQLRRKILNACKGQPLCTGLCDYEIFHYAHSILACFQKLAPRNSEFQSECDFLMERINQRHIEPCQVEAYELVCLLNKVLLREYSFDPDELECCEIRKHIGLLARDIRGTIRIEEATTASEAIGPHDSSHQHLSKDDDTVNGDSQY